MAEQPRPLGPSNSTSPSAAPPESGEEAATGTAVADASNATLGGNDAAPEAADLEKKPKKLNQVVEISDAGPCRKHVKVTIPRPDIDERLEEKFSELVTDSFVPGYRPGKAPRKLIERKFYADVAERLKVELLLQSLEQLSEEKQFNPITAPNLDPFGFTLPREGNFEYEFDVEVYPEFELPAYKGLRLKRPTRTIREEEVAAAKRRFLERLGSMEHKDGPAQMNDIVTIDLEIVLPEGKPTFHKGMDVRLGPQLSFNDGVIPDFGQTMIGVRAGESRSLFFHVAANVGNPQLREKQLPATVHVKAVKQLRLPELNDTLLEAFGVRTPEQFHEKIREILQSSLAYDQKQSARQQVLEHFSRHADWDLPPDLVQRQARSMISRKILEMQSAGLSTEEIRVRRQLLQKNALAAAERSLKERFILQKVAELEGLEVSENDIEYQIELIAERTGESPRRVRARLEKEEMLDSVATQILEAKALQVILDNAEYIDVPMEGPTPAVEVVEQQAIPGTAPEDQAAESAAAEDRAKS